MWRWLDLHHLLPGHTRIVQVNADAVTAFDQI
jgi:hypothetical protein